MKNGRYKCAFLGAGGKRRHDGPRQQHQSRESFPEERLHLDLLRLPLHPREADEDLLERRLTDRVVLDVVLGTHSLHGAKQTRPRQSRRPPDVVLNQPLMLVLELAGGERRADKLHQCLCLGLHRLRVPAHAQLDNERVALAELGLEMLIAAETLEPTVDHDRHPCTQRLALLHAVDQQSLTSMLFDISLRLILVNRAYHCSTTHFTLLIF